MRNRLLGLLGALTLAASLAACSSSSADEAGVPAPGAAGVSSSGPAASKAEQDSEELGDNDSGAERDDAQCEVLMTFYESITNLDLSATAENAIDSDDVDGIFAPVNKIGAELPLTSVAAVHVLEDLAHGLDEPYVGEDGTTEQTADDAVKTMTDTTRDVCGLPETWGVK